jgi:hypothetical protein
VDHRDTRRDLPVATHQFEQARTFQPAERGRLDAAALRRRLEVGPADEWRALGKRGCPSTIAPATWSPWKWVNTTCVTSCGRIPRVASPAVTPGVRRYRGGMKWDSDPGSSNPVSTRIRASPISIRPV